MLCTTQYVGWNYIIKVLSPSFHFRNDFTELWLMKAKTTSTGQKIVTRQTRIADPWSSVHSSQQHEILSKSIALRHVAILHLIWQWVLKEDLWDQKILFTDEGGKVVWWQVALVRSQNARGRGRRVGGGDHRQQQGGRHGRAAGGRQEATGQTAVT